jgi:hypothetical protein
LEKRIKKKGAVTGILGFVVCFYILPYALGITSSSIHLFKKDLGALGFKTSPSFGLDYLEPIHAFFLEYTVKHDDYLAISVSFKGNYRERNYAEMFVDIDKYITNHENAFVWKENCLHLRYSESAATLPW